MSMDVNELATKMQVDVTAAVGIPPTDPAMTVLFYTAMAKSIVEYLQAKADVLPGSMSNAGGPVTGTGKIS